MVPQSHDPHGVARRSRRAKSRRAYLLLTLGLVIPGSAQLVHGAKPLGRLGLRLWLTLVLLALLVGLATWLLPGAVVGLLAREIVMQGLAGVLVGVALVGLILLINTWWIARPRGLGFARGAVFTLIVVVLATGLVAGSARGAQYFLAFGQTFGSVLTGGGDIQAKDGRYNILLLGADSGSDREGLRPDSVTVASVDADSGRTVLFSLPRNLENVPFAAGSPLRSRFPYGYDNCGYDYCLLNSIYTLGLEYADLYPGADDPGVEAMIDAVEGVLGLDINYYAMVDMGGFAALIDAVGGINVTLSRSIDLGIMDDWMQEHIIMTVGPGEVHMDGETALLFSRSRIQGDDFQRMARQKCVMVAMLNQLNPTTVATNFLALADAAGNLLVTSVPSGEIVELGDLARRARKLPIISISFTPPLIDPAYADFDEIQQIVSDTIAAAEAADQAPPTAEEPPVDTPPDETGPGLTPPDPGEDEPANTVDDLAAECAAVA